MPLHGKNLIGGVLAGAGSVQIYGTDPVDVGEMARALVDDGTVGRLTSGTAVVMSHGMEHWHPNPDFFFLPGAGPVLDIGPYYVTNLVQLLGPVTRVAALTATPATERTAWRERTPVRLG